MQYVGMESHRKHRVRKVWGTDEIATLSNIKTKLLKKLKKGGQNKALTQSKLQDVIGKEEKLIDEAQYAEIVKHARSINTKSDQLWKHYRFLQN